MRKERGKEEKGSVRQEGSARARGEVSANGAVHGEAGGERSREGEAHGKKATNGLSRQVRSGVVHGTGGGGSAWRGSSAECVVREVRTPTEGGGCCNGAAHGTSREMRGGAAERRGQVRTGPRMEGGAVREARIRREGQICGNGAKHDTRGASATGS